MKRISESTRMMLSSVEEAKPSTFKPMSDLRHKCKA